MDEQVPLQQFKVEPLKKTFRLPRFTLPIKLLVLAVGIILVAGVLFLVFGSPKFSDHNVSFLIDGTQEVASGESVTYTIKYKNDNRTALTKTKLTVYYPPDSIIIRDNTIVKLSNETIDIGLVGASESGEKTVQMLLVGSQGSVKTLNATLTFTPEELASEIEKKTSATTSITTFSVPLTVVVPPTVVSGQEVTYFVDYRNQSGADLVDLKIKVTYPEGFVVASTNPKATGSEGAFEKTDYWDIKSLEEGSGGRITITGKLSGREKEAKTLAVTLQKQIPTSKGLVYVDFEKADATSVIATPLLSVILSVQETEDYVAHIGDRLDYVITVTNNSNTDLSSLILTAKIEGTMYDISTVQSSGNFDGRTSTILWNSAVVPELRLLRVNQHVAVPFTISLKKAFPGGNLGTKDSLIKIVAHVETPNVPEGFHGETLSADDSLITRVSTAPSFTAQLSLQDQQLGEFGPYPLRVDQTTAFTARWAVSNPSNEIINAKITATLLPGVKWENKVRVIGAPTYPSYNAKLNTITWDLGTIPGGVGVGFPAYEGFFQVSVTPSINQVGDPLVIVKDMRFSGTDSLTKEVITQNINQLITGSVEQ